MRVFIAGCGELGFLTVLECICRHDEIVAVSTSSKDKKIIALCDLYNKTVLLERDGYDKYEFDLGITVNSYGKIPDDLLAQARIGWIGYHPSLLPRHRGAAAIQWALKEKDPITGGTVYWLDSKYDHGDIAYQDWIFLDHGKTPRQVWDEQLEPMGFRLIRKALKDIKKGKIRRKAQATIERFATKAPRVHKNQLFLTDGVLGVSETND